MRSVSYFFPVLSPTRHLAESVKSLFHVNLMVPKRESHMVLYVDTLNTRAHQIKIRFSPTTITLLVSRISDGLRKSLPFLSLNVSIYLTR